MLEDPVDPAVRSASAPKAAPLPDGLAPRPLAHSPQSASGTADPLALASPPGGRAPPVLQDMLVGVGQAPTLWALSDSHSDAADTAPTAQAQGPAGPSTSPAPEPAATDEVWQTGPATPAWPVALLDPQARQSTALMAALQALGASAPQRLQWRQHQAQGPLASLLRSTWARPGQAPLRVLAVQSDLRQAASLEVVLPLLGAASLTVVLVDQLLDAELAPLCAALQAAVDRRGWSCPQLLFVLPAARHSAAAQLRRLRWSTKVRVETVQADLPRGPWMASDAGAAAQAWAPLLSTWYRIAPAVARPVPAVAPPTIGAPIGPAGTAALASARGAMRPSANDSRPVPLDDEWLPPPSAAGLFTPHPARDAPLAEASAETRGAAPLNEPDWPRLLQALQDTDGLLQCGIVDLDSGQLMLALVRPGPPGAPPARAGDTPPPMPSLELLAQSLWSARQAHGAIAGNAADSDEMLITAAGRQALLRRLSVPAPGRRGFVALVDRAQANLALLRFRLADAGRWLGR